MDINSGLDDCKTMNLDMALGSSPGLDKTMAPGGGGGSTISRTSVAPAAAQPSATNKATGCDPVLCGSCVAFAGNMGHGC